MKREIKKLLVANRGEIAVRIMRTCREMGIETVAVYSDADLKSLHVLHADEAVALGDPEPQESYLNIDKIIDAAGRKGVEAVHPGYGFLAENPEFAERCEKEGFIFIGPPSEAIRSMGDKVFARKLAADTGVAVIPGMLTSEGDREALAREAESIGFPVLIKASLGGGGKGMRIVNSREELEDALLQSSAEARKAFGDGSIYLEKYLKNPRHVEFQVLADRHSNVIHLHERECSIQRRYQKIIEESPSPAGTGELRGEMSEAALAIVKAAGYVNAGTVEFMVDESGKFYFLEMNTRIQVEHPITEMRTGIDLVRKQIEIAGGGELGLRQEDILPSGHSIECRIYAEDPEDHFYPSPGKVHYLEEPAGSGVRVDSGIRAGITVPLEYDPILSKIAVHGRSRHEAVDRMVRALKEYVILGIRTTIPFLIDVLESKAFREGGTHTRFIEENFPGWKPDDARVDLAGIAYIVHGMASGRFKGEEESTEEVFKTPWQTLGHWRM